MNTQCPRCGADNRADGHFCRRCGAKLPTITPPAEPPAAKPTGACPTCGASVRANAHFCPQCGTILAREAPAPWTATLPAMPPVPRLPASPALAIQPRSCAPPGGQMIVGNYNLLIQMGDVRDAVVNIVAPAAQPHPRPRATPVSLRPRPIPDFLDRQVEVAAAASALLSTSTVAFHGENGIGKTALLCQLAHHPAANAFRDGVIYLHAAHLSADDLAAMLYDALTTCDVPFHPTPAQLREGLQDRRALILLDDIALSREALEALLHLAPSCTFVTASETRRYWGPGQALELPGLPPAEGVSLLVRELGRPLAPEESFVAQRLAAAVNGHPLRLLQLAALARSSQRPLNDMLPLVQAPAQKREVTALALAALSEPERRVLAALAAVDAPLHAKPLARIVNSPDVQPALQSLMRQGWVQQHSPRYSLTGDLAAQLALLWDLEPWRIRALEVLTQWAEGQQTTPEDRREESDALIHSVEQAIAAKQWREALRLIRASEGALALQGRWGAWSKLLQHALEAARAVQDRPAEAWALHQLGTRAGCLGEKSASVLLTEALNLRQKLGDQTGAAITRHNLDIFLGIPPSGESPKEEPPEAARPKPEPPQSYAPRAAGLGLKQLGLLAAALVGIAILAWGGWQAWERNRHRITPEPPALTPSLWLADGCERSYTGDASSILYLGSNLDGWGYVRLDGANFVERALNAGTRENIAVSFANIEPGPHTFEATVVDAQETQTRIARCAFTVSPAETPPPVDTEGPPAPQLRAPKDNEGRYCPVGAQELPVEFIWSAISDPSGIAYYEVALKALEYAPRVYPAARTESPRLTETLPCPEFYRWQVRAFDNAGNAGAWSQPSDFYLRQEEDVTPPPPPESLAPGDPYPEYAESVVCPVTLRWNPVSDPSGVFYAVEVEAIYSSGNVQVLSRRDLNSTELLLEDSKTCYPYENYRWRVSSRDGAGNESGEWSSWLYYNALP